MYLNIYILYEEKKNTFYWFRRKIIDVNRI